MDKHPIKIWAVHSLFCHLKKTVGDAFYSDHQGCHSLANDYLKTVNRSLREHL